jgi:DNA uptake protein ComE-like DNA-binding protein
MEMKTSALALLLAAAFLPLPCEGQRDSPDSSPVPKSAVKPEDRVDLNHATVEQLLKVPGLTRPWAERIVRFRPYRSKQDLVDLGVLPGQVYIRIRDYVIAHRNTD